MMGHSHRDFLYLFQSLLISFLNGPSPASFSFLFGLLQTNINTILQQITVKNVHPVLSAGILSHDLQIVSHLP